MKLVLLPGIDGSGILFAPLLRALSPDIEPIVVTYPKDEPLGYAALLPQALRALPQEEPFVLLGESFGGPLALRAAQATTGDLRGLVLSASFITRPHPVPALASHLVSAFPFRLLPYYANIKKAFGLYDSPDLAALSSQALAYASPAVWARRLREVVRVDATDALASLACPALYLQGKHDLIVPARNLRRIQRIKPSVKIQSFAASHLVLQTQAVSAARAIEAFMRVNALR